MDSISPGVRADVTTVIKLYRGMYRSSGKRLARARSIEALLAAGVTVVIDLWGGGESARALVAAGFRVISVEDGLQKLRDAFGRPVSMDRKRRAFELDGIEGGYETRWGSSALFDALADTAVDGALLDFCGPWADVPRKAIEQSRRLRAIVVTLTSGHDMSTGATNAAERQMANQLYLSMARAEKPTWAAMNGSGGVRLLTDYDAPGGALVTCYLVGATKVKLAVVSMAERMKMRRDIREHVHERKRRWYHGLSSDRKEVLLAKGRRQPRQAVCRRDACGMTFVKSTARKYCSSTCAQAVHYEKNRARILSKRAAAVSGTAAEAVLDLAA